MAFIIKDRVKEATTSTGTGSVALAGSAATFNTFQSVLVTGDTTYYAIVHTSSGTDEWEVGLGTYNATTNELSRTTVLSGSAGTSAVNFSAGIKDVFMTYPASIAAYTDGSGDLSSDIGLGNHSTTELVEGSNLYYTDARVDAHLSGGTGVTYTAGTISIGQDVGTTADVTFNSVTTTDGLSVGGSLTVSGDLTVSGTTTTINATELAIEDNMIYLNEGSTLTNPDLGWVGNYNDGTYAHSGVFRDATDGTFKFFDGYTPEPGQAIDVTHASYNDANIQFGTATGNLTGNVTGNVTGDLTGNVTGSVTGNVTGNVTGDVTGNADTATALETARTIQLTGDVTGSVSFDGTGDAVISATVVDDSHAHVISNVDGLQAALDAKADDTTTISAGGGLTGGGSIGVNRTISHADTSTQASLTALTGAAVVSDVDLDTYGHVTALATRNLTLADLGYTGETNATADQTITAGGGLTGGGTGDVTISHADTSTQASVNNSNGTVIQDITLDGYGHVTGLASVNLDGRYVRDIGTTFNGTYPLAVRTALNNMYSHPDIQFTGSTATLSVSGDITVAGNSVFTDGYHPNADKWTTARTLSLSGDASGSVSWDGSANATLSVTVANDSHTHDGRYYTETEADQNAYAMDNETLFSILETDTTESLKAKFQTSSTQITRVEDSSAPAQGCFEVNNNFSPVFGPFLKVDDETEITFEFYAKFQSGSDSDALLYAGSQFFDSNKVSLGNVQRYWAASARPIDSNSYTEWHFYRGTLSGRGTATGQVHTSAEWMRLLFLFNYQGPNNVTRFCGLRVYKSRKSVTSLYRTSLGSSSSGNTTEASSNQLVLDTNGVLYSQGNAVWHAGNDGPSSGLDADLLDGLHASQLVPSGIIVMWSGASTAIPSGWYLCDGANGTPNLRDRFVVGAGSSYAVGATGGANTVTLATGNLPSHSHSVSLTTGGSGDHSHNFNANTGNSGNHTHTGSTSNTGSHNHTAYWANSYGGNNRFHQMKTSNAGTNNVAIGASGAHSHNFTTDGGGDHSHNFNANTGNSGNHTHSVSGNTGNAGSGTAHENRPPYYALCYIMKA